MFLRSDGHQLLSCWSCSFPFLFTKRKYWTLQTRNTKGYLRINSSFGKVLIFKIIHPKECTFKKKMNMCKKIYYRCFPLAVGQESSGPHGIVWHLFGMIDPVTCQLCNNKWNVALTAVQGYWIDWDLWETFPQFLWVSVWISVMDHTHFLGLPIMPQAA